LGELPITAQQAAKLQVKPYTQISGHLEICCLLVSANNSYERTAEDVAVLTGITISHSTQQRLVHRQEFPSCVADAPVEAISIDGGKARIRTPKGEPSIFNDYKAVVLEGQGIAAYFKRNPDLVDWANTQPLATAVSCLGDGHDGIWNLFRDIATPAQRREILDWYHLVENLFKVGGSLNRLHQVKALLWQGKVDEAIRHFGDCPLETLIPFKAYLRKHQARIPNYQYLQLEGFTIGSGGVESGIKQISRRIKISGAQWAEKNVDQVLKQRCAYLNGQFSPTFATPTTR
jgi:hypothetical protein